MRPISPSLPARSSRGASRRLIALVALLALVLAACGAAEEEPDASPDEADESAEPEAPPSDLLVVATTSILGDIVGELVQDDGRVEVLMGPGVDPHGFQPSAAEGAVLREADLVVANGLMLEENLVSALEAAEEEGVRVFEVADKLDPIEFDFDGPHDHAHGDDGHDEGDGHAHEDEDADDGHAHEDADEGAGHEGEEEGHSHDDEGDGHGHDDEEEGHSHDDEGDGHSHDDEGDGHGHDDEGDGHGHEHGDTHAHGPEDPHFWHDPIRTAEAVQLLAAELAEVDDHLDAEEWERRGEDYAQRILEVHEEVEELYASIPADNRKLVTNHDALGYLAARYDFEVLGTVIPGSSTQADADARSFSELIRTVEEAQVPAIFADNTDTTVLAEQLQSEVIGRSDLEIEVVRLYTDALGEPGSGAETYLDLLRTNAQRITDALS